MLRRVFQLMCLKLGYLSSLIISADSSHIKTSKPYFQ